MDDVTHPKEVKTRIAKATAALAKFKEYGATEMRSKFSQIVGEHSVPVCWRIMDHERTAQNTQQTIHVPRHQHTSKRAGRLGHYDSLQIIDKR